jgi:shikimate kinase
VLSGNDSNRNIVIVGFMGTGKSTVSRLLSERLGWESKDTDEEIERLTGRSVEQIFSADGEEVFRDWESKVLADLMSRKRLVVATGGGAVLREINRRTMLTGGWVVALTAGKQSLIRRLTNTAAAGTRPLLAGDAEERVSTLLETRRHAYDFAHVMVDTTKRSPSEVTELLLRWLPKANV